MKMVIVGLAAGIGFIVALSAVLIYADPRPPDVVILVDGRHYKAGIGSYGGSLPFGRGYGVDIDTSKTLPKDTIDAHRGTEIQFFSTASLTKPTFSQGWVWIVNSDSNNQYFLDKVDDNKFKVPNDVEEGDYVLTARATWDGSGLVSVSHHVHKIRIS